MDATRVLAHGTRLGQYRIDAFVARGGMGEVYRATDERLGREVAIKRLPTWLADDERSRERFLAEARNAAGLEHPNVLPVYDAGETDGILWIAMRYANGSDLKEILRRDGPLAPDRVIALLEGIADAIDAAHARGILHRDVKPANILVVREHGSERAYLSDFGLSTVARDRGLTRTGAVLGTVEYVSPEQARGEPLDGRSDVYSLAAVLFEALTGRSPFRRDSEAATLVAHLAGEPPRASDVRQALPEAIDAVLARGLALEPAGRYPTARDLVAGARAALGGQVLAFLFCDLRGYTSITERTGDAAAAALLARYRSLVRTALADRGGAEIRTEGDSFYATFASAGAAVRAGLAIVAAAADPPDGLGPIAVGVGINAGEGVDAPEGPIGSAVNLAARLCAAAAPGEVLVGSAVRDLLRTSGRAAFEARGRRSLKGIQDPVEVWAAVHPVDGAVGGVTVPRRATRRRAVIATVAGVAALITVGSVLAAGLVRIGAGPDTGTPSPSSGVAAVGPSAVAGSPAVAASTATASVPAPSSHAATPGPGPFPDAAETALLQDLPPGLAGQCIRGATQDDAKLAGFGGKAAINGVGVPRKPTIVDAMPPSPLAGVLCRPRTGASRLYVRRQSTTVVGADPSSDADEFLGYFVGRYGMTLGSCSTNPKAYELWTHSSGGSGGTIACFRVSPLDGRPWLYFTFGSGRYLAFATREDTDYAAIWAWWEGIRPLLP